ncbi:MAG: shikimate dehydrogenase, partial [Actinomycetota bacterium]
FQTRFDRSPAGLSFLIVGAGGAARSIVESLGRADASTVTVANRTVGKADDAATLAPQATAVALADVGPAEVAAVDVVVNTTAVGMAGGPSPDGSPIPVEGLHGDQRVVDIVYQPRMTPLLVAAADAGAATDGGVAMLIGQAALAFELWTGVDAPLAAMTAAVEDR